MAGIGIGLQGGGPLIAAYAVSPISTMVNGNTLFTISGGPVLIYGLVSVCITANNATASTLQYSITPTIGAGAQTISAASSSLANAAAGASVSLIGTTLTTAAAVNANGPNISMTSAIFAPVGTLTAVVGVGSTTGTWQHYMYYFPLAPGATVS